MRKPATSENAINALNMLSSAQDYFVKQLSQLCQPQHSEHASFTAQEWLRDNGAHGGGIRFEAPQNSLFNRGSVNVSQIQYEDRPDKAFISATALSTIIHPINPLVPSIHIHVSWTELRSGKNYWRLMADLNPAISCEEDTANFDNTLKTLGGQYYDQAKQAGDDYFYIPALKAHRGVSHFYLEGFNPEGIEGNAFAKQFVTGVIDSYIAIFSNKLTAAKNRLTADITQQQKQTQLDYHTLYFYQVLTLDKGTTAGLLIHNQNDVGTLGSLPRFVNRHLLSQWIEKTPAPRDQLVNALVLALADNNGISEVTTEVTTEVKINIVQVMREHYKSHAL